MIVFVHECRKHFIEIVMQQSIYFMTRSLLGDLLNSVHLKMSLHCLISFKRLTIVLQCGLPAI